MNPKEPEGMSEQRTAADVDPDYRDLYRDLARSVASYPEEFWRALSAKKIRALLAAAPRVAGGWVNLVAMRGGPTEMAFRPDEDGHPVASVEVIADGSCTWSTVVDSRDAFGPERAATLDAAMTECDRRLTEAGWLLEDEAST